MIIIVINVTGTTAVITDLQPDSDYAYQVECIVDEQSYSSAVAVLQTEEAIPQVSQVNVAPHQTTAQVSWEGYGRSFNVSYAVDMAADNQAKVTLTAGDVWEDGSGYQMLLDADANTFGSIIPDREPLTQNGNASSEVYAEFEYKIPESADGDLNTKNIVFKNSVTIDIPAGTYDWCITNPLPAIEMMFIASFRGNIGGRKDNYVFEAGKHYTFNVSLDGDYDRVDVEASPMYGEWTQVTVDDGALTTKLSALNENTQYVVQVQAVLEDGKTSPWSPAVSFTTKEDYIATGIENVQRNPSKDQRDGWYTIDGRKLSGKPVGKGVYIHNESKSDLKLLNPTETQDYGWKRDVTAPEITNGNGKTYLSHDVLTNYVTNTGKSMALVYDQDNDAGGDYVTVAYDRGLKIYILKDKISDQETSNKKTGLDQYKFDYAGSSANDWIK